MTIFFLQSSSYKKLKSSTCYPFQLCLLMLNLGNGLIDMDQSICSWQTHFSKKKKKSCIFQPFSGWNSVLISVSSTSLSGLVHFFVIGTNLKGKNDYLKGKHGKHWSHFFSRSSVEQWVYQGQLYAHFMSFLIKNL